MSHEAIVATLKIGLSFIVLFILPFILVTFKIFHDKDKFFQIYVSMIIGLFSSVALVYLLAAFNAFDKVNFLVSYSSIIVVSNVYFLTQIKQPKISFKLRLAPGLLLLLFAFGIGSYMRLYDPMKHISLGMVDFYEHLRLLKATVAGHIFTSYPKGYHIILSLIYFVSGINFYSIVRFTGAFFGIISIGAVYCFVKQVFGGKSAIFPTLFYSGFTVFNYLTVEQTGSWPQGFGFVLIPLLIYFAVELIHNFKENNILKRNVLVFIFIVFILSLVSPYAMLQMSYILYFLLFFSMVFHPSIRRYVKQFFRNIAALMILFSLGMCIVLSYYTILSEAHNVEIRLPTYDEPKIAKLIEEGESKPEAMEQSTRFSNWTTNKWAIIRSLVRIKRLRVPVEFPLSIGVYAGLLLGLFVLVISVRRRSLEFFAISIFVLLFGVSCITGILEFPRYSGRSGWYFMLGSIWLGGIVVKRFYDQELIRDIFHLFKRVNPLRITNKGMNIKKSRASLIYFMVTLSGLVSYLVIVWALGLLRVNPIRDVSLLLLITITIFIVGKKKRDILSGERVSSCFPGNARLYLSLHKTLVLTAVLVVMLYPLPRPPEYNFRYYHRSINEDDLVKVVQEVKEKFPLPEVKMFFGSDIVYRARDKVANMVYPLNIGMAEIEDILSGIGDRRYNFLLLDRKKEKSEFVNKISEWISRSQEQHNNVRLFYDSENIVVYLVENYNVSGPYKN